MKLSIYLHCESVEKVGPGEYQGKFLPMSVGGPVQSAPYISAKFDCPVVPGQEYELLLGGLFPGWCDNRPCVGEIRAFSSPDELEGINPNEYTVAKEDRKQKEGTRQC